MASRCVRRIAPLVALTLFAGTAVAQQASQAPPECRNLSYRSNFRLNGAEQHILAAAASKFDDDRRNRIADAQRLLEETARAGGADVATLWYLFGQMYLLKHDLVGADSAFTKVEAITDPECKRDIMRRRRNEWIPLQNAGVELMSAGNPDSALTVFRRGGIIYRGEPYAFLNMATIFVNRDQNDSAIFYFRAAAHSTDDRRSEEARQTALFNAARLLHRAALDSASIRAEAQQRGVPDSAVENARLLLALAAYQDVLRMHPRDLPAQASLAGVLGSLHRTEEARAVYDSMLAHADSMSSFDLFEAGVALFRQQRYDLTARAIELGLTKNRCQRDALFNLANAHFAARDSVHLLDAARRLVAVDSMNRGSLRLLAVGLQKNGDPQGTLRVLMKTDSLPWEITIVRFEGGDSTATVRGVVSNLQDKSLPGFRLTIEFVNAACEVVASQPVNVPDLNANTGAGASYDFSLTASGRGIVAWKYKTN
jgi:hypothetical protein